MVLDALPIEKASSIFMQVDNRNRLEIVSHLHQSAFQKLVSVLSREELHVAEYWRSFPEGTVGRIMDPLSQYCVLSGNLTAKEATSAIVEKDFTTESVYVIDDEGNLLGAIPLVKFAALVVQDLQESLESQEITLSELALQEPQLYTVKTSVLIVEFARDLNRRPVNANGFVVPVVDENGLLKGFVTAHDALQATTKEWVSIAQKTASMEGIQVYSFSLFKCIFFLQKEIQCSDNGLKIAGNIQQSSCESSCFKACCMAASVSHCQFWFFRCHSIL